MPTRQFPTAIEQQHLTGPMPCPMACRKPLRWSLRVSQAFSFPPIFQHSMTAGLS